jgi:EVE domain
MNYYLNLFTPETWTKFQEHGASVSGFRYRQRRAAKEDIHEGDVFLCYLVHLSRWCGVLRVLSEAYEDSAPIFSDPDVFVVRFKVEAEVILDPEHSIPIFEDKIWTALKETRGIAKGAPGWAKYYRGSLRQLDRDDGQFLASLLKQQDSKPIAYPFTERDKRQLSRFRKVKTVEGEVTVVVPSDDEEHEDKSATALDARPPDTRQSIQFQAKLAEIGTAMGFKIWLPRSDKSRIKDLVPVNEHHAFLETLPLNYDDTTLDTIEQIDVLWLKGRSIVRAFEVEHTTAVYSGLLRMADLLALQPNMNIRLHIVAPDDRREKVFREMLRPVFSLLDRGPLSRSSTFISYESVEAIRNLEYLTHTNDSIISEYEEEAETEA